MPLARLTNLPSLHPREEPGAGGNSPKGDPSPMRSNLRFLFLFAALISFGSAAAAAQTDLALSLYGAFAGSTNGNGTVQSPSNSAGGLLELRHISNPLVGYDVTYSYNRDNQTYKNSAALPCPSSGCTVAAVSANAHELSGDWVVSVRASNLRPFALAGVGLLLNVPTGNQSNTTSSTKPAFLYGAGLDWGLVPHLGLRFQYRGNLYKAPDLTTAFSSTSKFTETSEPMIGAYLKF
jgi:opacity protein-like surface antigen